MDLEYDVVVRNELSGEVAVVRVLSDCWQAAQVEALVTTFKNKGWRKGLALVPSGERLPEGGAIGGGGGQ